MLHGYQFTETVLVGDNEDAAEATIAGDPTFKPMSSFRIVGNKERDLWKRVAFTICETAAEIPEMEKATIGALCGHRKSMLAVSTNWEDKVRQRLRHLLILIFGVQFWINTIYNQFSSYGRT